jgi:Tfp pilus assembly protein PilW
MKSIFNKRKGFSLIEMLIYIAILILVLIVLIQVMMSFSTNYKKVSTLRLIDRSATETLERITRDIRNASSVTLASSVLGAHPGELTIVASQSSVSTTTRFYIGSGTVRVDVNGTYIGPLSTDTVTVDNLVFKVLTTSASTAVKIDMTLSASYNGVSESKDYSSTIILKGS